tara:strand:+ start:37 stop:1464 length:1428 start_codon:yes stop_codon:yes gene_type:complete
MKSNFTNSISDFGLPIMVVIIIFALLLFFKWPYIKNRIPGRLAKNTTTPTKKTNVKNSTKKTNVKNKILEHFEGGVVVDAAVMAAGVVVEDPDNSTKSVTNIDLSGLDIKIHGDLFTGFESRETSDKQLKKIKEIIYKNPDKFKMIDIKSNNIFINHSVLDPVDYKLVLGSDKVESNTIDKTFLDEINSTTYPKFYINNDKNELKQIYYNSDDTSLVPDKLCIGGEDTTPNCITANDLNKYNGTHMNQLKLSNSDDYVKPYNIEYNSSDERENGITNRFYRKSTDYTILSNTFGEWTKKKETWELEPKATQLVATIDTNGEDTTPTEYVWNTVGPRREEWDADINDDEDTLYVTEGCLDSRKSSNKKSRYGNTDGKDRTGDGGVHNQICAAHYAAEGEGAWEQKKRSDKLQYGHSTLRCPRWARWDCNKWEEAEEKCGTIHKMSEDKHDFSDGFYMMPETLDNTEYEHIHIHDSI